MSSRILLVTLVTAALASLGGAQGLIKDINPSFSTSVPSSAPTELQQDGFARILFSASDRYGREPWSTDGTAVGTFRIGDVNFGTGSSNPADFTNLNGTVFFSADDGNLGRELWKTTSVTTVALALDIRPGSVGSDPRDLFAYAGKLYFTADDGVNGRELWVTNGTTAPTLLKDIHPTGSANPHDLEGVGPIVYFAAFLPSIGIELWCTDGTTAGTRLVADILPGSASSDPGELTEVISRSRIVFAATTTGAGRELWTSDGTVTTLVADLRSNGDSSPGSMFVFSSATVYFAATGASGRELYVTDGTANGTRLVADLEAGSGSSSPFGLARGFQLELFFFATTAANGTELYRSDGTTAGTTLLKDVAPGAASGCVGSKMTRVGNSPSRFYFAADDGISGRELWVSDGTAAGTALVFDTKPGASTSNPHDIVPLNSGSVLFAAEDGSVAPATGVELWCSNNTGTSAFLVKDIDTPRPLGSNPVEIVAIGTIGYFDADDGANGRELWRSDRTAAGTTLVRDINPGPLDSGPQELTVVGTTLFFVADDGVTGRELWKSDGTTGGTVLVADIRPGAVGSRPFDLLAVGTKVFFNADDGAFGRELWVSDGTAAGTRLVADLRSGPSAGVPNGIGMAALNGKAYFVADNGTSGAELWSSDGVTAQLVLDIRPGSAGSQPASLQSALGRVFFSANDGTSGTELWSTGGTGASTSLARDIRPGSQGSFPFNVTPYAGGVMFGADDGTHGKEPWTSNGTSGGTVLVHDVNPAGDSTPSAILPFTRSIYFCADDGVHGREMWRTGGTGATLVQDLLPGAGDGHKGLAVRPGSGQTIVFAGDDGLRGNEPFVSEEGTAASTHVLRECFPGGVGSDPMSFVRAGTWVFFTADDPVVGRELFGVPLREAGSALVDSYGTGCTATALVPRIGALDVPSPGTSGFAVELTSASPSASALLLLGASAADLALGQCRLLVAPMPLVTLPAATDALGTASVGIPVPNDKSLIGQQAFFQWAVAELQGPLFGVAGASDGLLVLIGH